MTGSSPSGIRSWSPPGTTSWSSHPLTAAKAASRALLSLSPRRQQYRGRCLPVESKHAACSWVLRAGEEGSVFHLGERPNRICGTHLPGTWLGQRSIRIALTRSIGLSGYTRTRAPWTAARLQSGRVRLGGVRLSSKLTPDGATARIAATYVAGHRRRLLVGQKASSAAHKAAREVGI